MIFEPAKRVKAIPRNFFNQLDEKISRVEDKATLIDLAKGNPDQPTPDFIVTALKQAVDQPKNHGYTPFDGKKNLLNAIADYYQREHGVQIDPQKEVLTFTGSVIGITALPQTLLNPGDYVITTNPCYPEYYSAVSLAGGKLWQLDINPANHYLPDLTSVPKDVLAKAKILLLNYPNNPTGATATQAFFNQAIEFGKQNGILVVNDFAYAALGFNGQAVSLLQSSGSKEYAVELNTLSKTYNMAGWRVGYVVGNESVITALKQYHSHVYSTVFGAVQDAAVVALESQQESVQALNQLYQERRDTLVTALNQLGWHVAQPQGTFFVWCQVPQGYDGETFADLILQQANVVVAPGIGFGSGGKNFIRISLIHDKTVLQEAGVRLGRLKY